jgi:hypothetical protein
MLGVDGQLFRIDADGLTAKTISVRVSPDHLELSEAQFRDMLRSNPALLQKALGAGDMWDGEEWYYVGSEVGLPGIGRIDLLFVDDVGRPIVVETKLYRNPEARRRVVAQVSEYALQLSTLSAASLLEGADLPQEVLDLSKDIDDHLRRGSLTLVIAGDLVGDRAIRLGEALLGTNRPEQTSLAFVELAIFEDGHGWLVAPLLRRGIVAQVREVFEIQVREGDRILQAAIRSLPPPVGASTVISESGLLDAVATTQGANGRQVAEELLAFARSLGAEVVFRKSGASVRIEDPGGSGVRATLFVISSKGTFYVWWLGKWERLGVAQSVAADYLEALTSALGVSPAFRPTKDKDAVPLKLVAQHCDQVADAVRQAVAALRAAEDSVS